MRRIAQLGFAWLEPVSVIEEEIAKDSVSPIALAHTIAIKNGTTPGRTGGVLHIFALLPAVVMAALDPRRRRGWPRWATRRRSSSRSVSSSERAAGLRPAHPRARRHDGGIRADDRRGRHRWDGRARARTPSRCCHHLTRRARLKQGSRGNRRSGSRAAVLIGQASRRLTPVILDVTHSSSIAAAATTTPGRGRATGRVRAPAEPATPSLQMLAQLEAGRSDGGAPRRGRRRSAACASAPTRRRAGTPG